MGNEASLPLQLGATFDTEEIKRLGKRSAMSFFLGGNVPLLYMSFLGLGMWVHTYLLENF